MQRPLYSGSFLSGPSTTWEVDPTTRCVTSPVPVPRLAELAPLHAEHGSNLFRVFQRQDLVAVPRLGREDLMLVAKLEHELDHLQRHLATSYGLVVHLVRSRMVDLFFRRPSLSAGDDAARLPWYPLHGRQPRQRWASASPLATNERLYLAYRSLLQLWSADSASPFTPTNRECRAAFAALVCDLFPNRLQIAAPPRANSIQQRTRDWFPIWYDADERPFKMGATGLLESLAISRELSLMRYANLAAERDDDQLGSSVYRQASYVWRNVFHLPQLIDVSPSEAWRRLGYEKITSPPWEFQAAVDLALWLPLGPVGIIGPARTPSWSDIHPGWRFASILTLLKEHSAWYAEREITQTSHEWVRTTQNNWCRQLGWPSPDELIAAWIPWLVQGYQQKTLARRYVEDDRARWAGALNLLAKRQSEPAALVIGFPDAAGSPVNWFEAVFGPDEDNVLHVYGDESRLEQLAALGYPFPVAYGVIQAIELFAEHLGNSTQETLDWRIARLKRLGPKLEKCVKTYAKRHYNLEVGFDGKLPEK